MFPHRWRQIVQYNKLMKTMRIDKKGFTLIELLVVISIIGILASFSYVSYLSSQKVARDTQRRSDINQYRLKLEQFANTGQNSYPIGPSYVSAYKTGGTNSVLCNDLGMSPCLEDPSPGSGYYYFVDSSGVNFKLYVELEAAGGWWEVCSEGKSGFLATQTPGPSNASGCDL